MGGGEEGEEGEEEEGTPGKEAACHLVVVLWVVKGGRKGGRTTWRRGEMMMGGARGTRRQCPNPGGKPQTLVSDTPVLVKDA